MKFTTTPLRLPIAIIVAAGILSAAGGAAYHAVTTATSQSPSANAAPAHVVGNQIIDSTGRRVELRGAMIETSFAYVNQWTGNGTPNSAQDPSARLSTIALKTMRNWGMTALRTDVSAWMYKLPFDGGTDTADYMNKLDAAVKAANAEGLYVVLDFHSDSASNLPTGKDQSGQPYHTNLLYSENLAFWSTVAAHFASNPMVMYDVINEPQYVNWTHWQQGGFCKDGDTACVPVPCDKNKPGCIVGVPEAISSIRASGAQIIVLEPGRAGGTSNGESGGWLGLPDTPLTSDPNVIYSRHEYQYIISGYFEGASANPPDYSVWDTKWAPGQILGVHPIYYGEWAVLPHGQTAHCESTSKGVTYALKSTNADAITTAYLDYLDARGAASTAWEFQGYDGTGHLVGHGSPEVVVDEVGVNGALQATDFTSHGPWACGDTNPTRQAAALASGMGQAIQTHLAAQPRFDVTVPPTQGAASAGTPVTVTVTATNSAGAPDTTYTGTVAVRSSDSKAVLPTSLTFTSSDHGSKTLSATLPTVGVQTVSVADKANSNRHGIVTVVSTPALHIAVSPARAPAGTATTLTVTATDGGGAPDTAYVGSIHFSSSDRGARLPADYSFTGSDRGSRAFTGVTFATAGTQTVTAADRAVATTTATASVTVGGSKATSLDLTGPPSATAGTPVTLTVTARDGAGNIDRTYSGTTRFTSSDGRAVLPSAYQFRASDGGVHTFTDQTTLGTAGAQTLSVSDGSLSGTASLTVASGPATALTVSGPSSTTAGAPIALTVTAEDRYGNVATSYGGTVRFTSSDSTAILHGLYTFQPADRGTRTFQSAATLNTAGNQTITIADNGGGLTTTRTVTVAAGTATQFQVTTRGAVTAGSIQRVVVTALDAFGNVATGYQGTVHFVSSDPAATLPPDTSFQSGDAGVHTFAGSLMLETPGTQTVTVKDTTDHAISGTATVKVKA